MDSRMYTPPNDLGDAKRFAFLLDSLGLSVFVSTLSLKLRLHHNWSAPPPLIQQRLPPPQALKISERQGGLPTASHEYQDGNHA